MAGGKTASSKPTRVRKRVEVESSSPSSPTADASAGASLKRARDGSAFTRCDGCNKDVAVALISFHNCSLDAQIKMNLEAQVVDMPTEVKKKPTEKRKAKTSEPKAKKGKNPNAPKRPQTAFFVFMEEFRKTFKKANPDCKSASTVAKESGLKWKSLTDEEKKPYVDRAAELKAEYEKRLECSTEDAENVDDNEDAENANANEDAENANANENANENENEEEDKSAEKEVQENLDDY